MLLRVALLMTVPLLAAAAPDEELKPFSRVQLPPVDESVQDAGFAAFWKTFQGIVEKHDGKQLMGVVADDIIAGWDGANGIDEFRRVWKLDAKSEASPLWDRLTAALRLGVARDTGEGDKPSFAAPALYVKFPEDLGPYTHLLIAGEKVNVRESPTLKSPVVSQESYTVVRDLREPQPKQESIGGAAGEWIRVLLPEGKPGYVFSQFLRDPLDYRARFEQRDGAWKLTAFVAGD